MQTKTAIASSAALLSSKLPDLHLGHEYLTKGIKSVVMFPDIFATIRLETRKVTSRCPDFDSLPTRALHHQRQSNSNKKLADIPQILSSRDDRIYAVVLKRRA